MTTFWRPGVIFVGAAIVSALLALLPVVASAVVYETAPPFCEGEAVHDYLTPVERMPKLHEPPKSGQLGFGPRSLKLHSSSDLIVGEGSIGYSLYVRSHAHSVHPRWEITTTISRVDWKGRLAQVVERTRGRVATISREHRFEVSFDVPKHPAVYRLTAIFQSRSGRKLGGYGFYSRVVAPTRHAQLSLNAESFRPETTVFGRLENFGTASIFYGVPYVIERLESSTWVRAPESPRVFILPLYETGAGLTSKCSSFWIRPTMSGRYRMAKQIEYGTWPPPKERRPVTVTAEFDVVP